jgi:hypothetical protein
MLADGIGDIDLHGADTFALAAHGAYPRPPGRTPARPARPKEIKRINLRGSKSSTPDTGQVLAHMAQATQQS